MYSRSLKHFDQSKYQEILHALDVMKTFDDELNVCKTWSRSLSKRAFPCQPVHSKMSIEPLPKELQGLRLENILIFKRFFSKKLQLCMEKASLQN